MLFDQYLQVFASFFFQTTVQVKNSNYFRAKASNFSVEVTWDNYVVTLSNFQESKAVPARSSEKVSEINPVCVCLVLHK